MSNKELGQASLTGISDQQMLAKVDALVARGEDMADGKIQPENDSDRSQMLWTLLGRVLDQQNAEQKEELDKIHQNWRGRWHAELQTKYNKPTTRLPSEFPTFEQMLRDLEFIYRQIVPLVH